MLQDRRRLPKHLAGIVSAVLAMSLPAFAVPSVWTEHNDNSRTGQNLAETSLTPANVNPTGFGALFHYTLDDQTYSQPLYVPGLTMSVDGKVHNVVFVSTVNNSVYAFDADSNSANGGNPLWKVSLTPSGARPPQASDADAQGACGGSYHDIAGKYGIIGTPVIDTTTNTLYIVARDVENTSTFVQRLHALDVTSGDEKFGGPVAISGSSGGVNFDPALNNQRPALALINGVVYIAWSSHCDNGAYHGFLMGYNASTLAQTATWSSTNSNGGQAGIWQGGQGITADGSNNLYLMTGNGTWDGNGNYGESFVKLSTTLAVQDYFTPSNYSTLNGGDTDLGAAGCVGIPGTTMVFGGGKQGMVYLLNTANMGHESGTDQVVQEFQATFPTSGATGHIHGGPVYFNSANGQFIYLWGENDFLRAFKFTNGASSSAGSFNTTATATSTMRAPMSNTGMPGGFLSISANGSSNGIVWALTPYNGDANQNVVQGILHAFDAQTFAGANLNELWNSKQNVGRDDFGNYAKFTYPTIANGKVYISSWGTAASAAGQLWVYGLLGSTAPAAPSGITPTALNSKVQLAWSTSGGATSYSVFRGTTAGGESGTAIATGITTTNYTDTAVTNGTTYYYKLTAVNAAGTSPLSAEVSATPSATAPIPVNISTAYNVTGIYTDGSTFSATGGIDGGGAAYSATLLEPGKTWNNIPFTFGPANASDCVTNTTISLPAGQYSTLSMLATGLQGNQVSQTFTVTYTDNTTSTFTQSMSDWFTPQSYAGESIAVSCAYRNSYTGTQDARTFDLYGYSFALNSAKTIKSITLPANQNVVVTAITLTPVAAAADFGLSASPASVTENQGGTTTSTVTVGPLNGFTSSVALTTSGLPTGVTASFNPASTTGTSTLTFTASSTAATGTKAVTVTGTSGSLTHTTTVNLTVNATTTTNYPVSLSSFYNTFAIYTDGTTFTAANSLDGVGYAYSSTQLGASTSYGGQTLTYGAANVLDGVNSKVITVPAGQYGAVRLIACGLNGNQVSQTFTATYSDGTTQTFTQSLSDWAHPQSYTGETTQVTTTYRNASNGTKNTKPIYLCAYALATNAAKTLTSITLPTNRNVVVLAMGLNGVQGAAPASVNLSSAFNLIGIYADGATFATTAGIDGVGSALSGTLLGTSQTWSSTPFTIGAAGANDVVTSAAQVITLPAGKFSSLKMLALAINGNQANQGFTVTYSDGSTSGFTQSISDWFTPQSYAGESIANAMAYRNNANGTKDARTFDLYGYSFALTNTKTVSSVTLPATANVKVLSMTLVP